MIFDLTDEDRAALEAHRIGLGLRSHAETLRALIRREPLRLGGAPVYPDETARLPQPVKELLASRPTTKFVPATVAENEALLERLKRPAVPYGSLLKKPKGSK